MTERNETVLDQDFDVKPQKLAEARQDNAPHTPADSYHKPINLKPYSNPVPIQNLME